MSKKKFKIVLIVLGGTSGERAVSLDSGKACIKALKRKKVVLFILYIISKYNIKGVPTLILFKDGNPIDQRIGALTKNQLLEFLNQHI